MADYWKSTAKKYCDFCKCWIGDDRMTLSLHENGKRHKDNVSKKLSAIQKKSAKDHKQQVKVNQEMKKMEEAAMKAYMKDIEANADLTSQNINETLAKTNSTLVLANMGFPDDSAVSEEPTVSSPTLQKSQKHKPPPKPNGKKQSGNKNNKSKKKNNGKVTNGEEANMWCEAKSDDGHIYYWNVKTNDTMWEPPADGKFLCIEEQEILLEKDKKRRDEEEEEFKKHETEIRAEEKARNERENMKKLKVESVQEPTYLYGPGGPNNKVDPYGKWTTVVSKVDKTLDLQLPKQDLLAISVPILIHSEKPTREFKERQITNLGISDDEIVEVGFKKRKFGGANRKNTRQRLNDE